MRVTLTDEEFKEIYVNRWLRNKVSEAMLVYNVDSSPDDVKTIMYGMLYDLTEEQINEAKRVREEARVKALENVGNRLIFTPLGMTFDNEEGVEVSFRQRTQVRTKEGLLYMLEISVQERAKEGVKWAVTELVDITNPEEKNYTYSQENNLIGKSAKDVSLPELLRLTNEVLKTDFKEVEVDCYDLNYQEFECKDFK